MCGLRARRSCERRRCRSATRSQRDSFSEKAKGEQVIDLDMLDELQKPELNWAWFDANADVTHGWDAV